MARKRFVVAMTVLVLSSAIFSLKRVCGLAPLVDIVFSQMGND